LHNDHQTILKILEDAKKLIEDMKGEVIAVVGDNHSGLHLGIQLFVSKYPKIFQKISPTILTSQGSLFPTTSQGKICKVFYWVLLGCLNRCWVCFNYGPSSSHRSTIHSQIRNRLSDPSVEALMFVRMNAIPLGITSA
jgi:hypothetical protein